MDLMDTIIGVPSIDRSEAAVQARINALHEELGDLMGGSPRWVRAVQRLLGALALQGSQGLSGLAVSIDDALAAIDGAAPAQSSGAAWPALTGARRALTYVGQLGRDEGIELSAALLRSLQFLLAEHDPAADPGRWREAPIATRGPAHGEPARRAPDPQRVPELVEAALRQLALSRGLPDVARAAVVHRNIVAIGPFSAANGRLARCIHTLVLTERHALAPELCSIDEYLGTHGSEYHEMLGRALQGAETAASERAARAWVRFCLGAHVLQATSLVRRARRWEEVWRELESLVAAHHLPDRSIAALFDAALGLRVRNSSYRATLQSGHEGISHQVATTDLRAMAQAGLLEPRGNKRGTSYGAAGRLRRLGATYVAGELGGDASTLFDHPVPGTPMALELPFG